MVDALVPPLVPAFAVDWKSGTGLAGPKAAVAAAAKPAKPAKEDQSCDTPTSVAWEGEVTAAVAVHSPVISWTAR